MGMSLRGLNASRTAGLFGLAMAAGWCSAGADTTLPPVGMYIWYDQPVWCAADWQASNPCMNNGIYMWGGNYLCNTAQNAYDSVVQMATNTVATDEIPQAAQVFGGTTFMSAETLTPDGAEFKPWSSFSAADLPQCYHDQPDPVGAMKQDVYHAHASFISGLKGADGANLPVGLMFSNDRTLRWGRWLTSHVDPDGTHWGGRTQLNNTACGSVGSGCADPAPAPCDCSDGGAGSWSLYWPDNATYSSIDDYDITINFANRVVDFTQFAQQGIAAGDYDFGPKPVIDVYLDLEMFQLSKVAPAGSATDGYGVYYPGTENMPSECRDHITEDPDAPAWYQLVLTYWQVPASVADALWRTLRDVRAIVDAHNAMVSDQEWKSGQGVRLSMSVWAQEAYRFVSPRFAVEDTMTNANSWNSTTGPGYGMFNQPFGTAKVDSNGDGTGEPWNCDCCTLTGETGGPDFTSTVIDDFSILNCIYKYADRVVFGTYQSVPAALDQVKTKYHLPNMACDFVGPNGTAAKPILDWKPGDGVPIVGPTGGTGFQVDFTKAYTYDVSRPYQYSAIGAWPPDAGATDPTPDWSQITDCDNYWGFYDTSIVRPGGVDIPTQGWVPFASRFLRGLHRWQQANPSSPRQPKAVFALEMTALDTYNAGSSTACKRNSYGNQWVWGNSADPSAPCATDVLAENLCQADRVLYVIGTDTAGVTPTADSSITISNAWGIRPAMRLWQETPADDDGSGSAMLADYLDTTAFAMNNYFSYHCMFSHQPFAGTYTSRAMCSATHAPNTPGWCNDPWGSCYGGCAIPGSHVRPSPVALFMRHDGLPGDVNNDRVVGVDDMLAIVAAWGVPCSGPCAVDHDGDGMADIDDLLGVIDHWSTE